MKTITKTINIYRFEELKKDIQESIIEDDAQSKIDITTANLTEISKELLELIGFQDVEVNYSLNYCQGDGFCFDFKNSDSMAIMLLNNFKNNTIKENGYKILENIMLQCYELSKDIDIENNILLLNEYGIFIHTEIINSRYNHSKTRNLYISESVYDDIPEQLEKFYNQISDIIEKIYEIICYELERFGYEMFEYRMSISEYSNYDDNWYTEDGILYLD